MPIAGGSCNFPPAGILSARVGRQREMEELPKMRSEIVSMVTEIKQSIELLRGHL